MFPFIKSEEKTIFFFRECINHKHAKVRLQWENETDIKKIQGLSRKES